MITKYLSESVLARRFLLPEKPAPVFLDGKLIRLEPLVLERDARALFECSNGNPITMNRRSIGRYDPDELIWGHLAYGPFRDSEDLKTTLEPLVNRRDRLYLCVFDVESGRQVGVVNYENNAPMDLKVEIGVWYSPIVQHTLVNTEAAYLMLKHAFDLGYRRVEWKCSAQNERSRRSALRLGFVFEGIQESHRIVKNQNRDTAWYRILEAEWPSVKTELSDHLTREHP